jgi:multisubunit Na+/H+ antiporter MnhB subunit
LALTLGPLAALAVIYFVLLRRHYVSRRVVVLSALVVLGLGGWLSWLGTSQRLDPQQHYVPAQFRDGEIVQGHGQ